MNGDDPVPIHAVAIANATKTTFFLIVYYFIKLLSCNIYVLHKHREISGRMTSPFAFTKEELKMMQPDYKKPKAKKW